MIYNLKQLTAKSENWLYKLLNECRKAVREYPKEKKTKFYFLPSEKYTRIYNVSGCSSFTLRCITAESKNVFCYQRLYILLYWPVSEFPSRCANTIVMWPHVTVADIYIIYIIAIAIQICNNIKGAIFFAVILDTL